MLLPGARGIPMLRQQMTNHIFVEKSQNCCHYDRQQNNKTAAVPAPGRSILSASFRRGSLTLEAALTLPLFVMILTAFLSFFSIMMVELKIQSAMYHAGKQIAAYYYAMDQIQGDSEKQQSLAKELGGSLAIYAVSETVVRNRIMEEAGSIPASVVEGGGSGLSFLGSRFDEASQDVVINVSYRMVIPFCRQD